MTAYWTSSASTTSERRMSFNDSMWIRGTEKDTGVCSMSPNPLRQAPSTMLPISVSTSRADSSSRPPSPASPSVISLANAAALSCSSNSTSVARDGPAEHPDVRTPPRRPPGRRAALRSPSIGQITSRGMSTMIRWLVMSDSDPAARFNPTLNSSAIASVSKSSRFTGPAPAGRRPRPRQAGRRSPASERSAPRLRP